jgi:hypothetical protein
MKKSVSTLLQKEMSRKEFLQLVGGSIFITLGGARLLSAIGITVPTGALLGAFVEKNNSRAFGTSKFGI